MKMYILNSITLLILISLLFKCVLSVKSKATEDIHTISLKNYTTLNTEVLSEQSIVPANTEIGFQLIDIPTKVNFFVIQIHSYLYNVSLTYTGEPKSLTGQNVGFVYTVTALKLPVFYINNNNTVGVSIMVAIIGYGANVPIPGGCNMEFATKEAPYLELYTTNSMSLIGVQSQLALFKKCSEPMFVSYSFYHMYQNEYDFSEKSYFTAISSMISPIDIMKNGRLVPASPLTSPMRRLFSAYSGTGSVYAVIATVYGTNISSAYIPAHTYACNMLSGARPCIMSPITWIVSALIFTIIGTYLTLYGHWFFRLEMFLLGLSFSILLVYVFNTSENLSATQTPSLWVLILIGIICGRLWVFIWNGWGNPMISITLSSLALSGILFAILMYTPYGDNILLQSNINYVLVFACISFIVLILFSVSPQFLNIVSCSVIGSYLIIFSLDYFFGTNLKYIFINPIRRMTVDKFNMAIIDPPYQNIDLLLSIVWGILIILGIISQKFILEGRPTFPDADSSYSNYDDHFENRPFNNYPPIDSSGGYQTLS